MHITCKQERGVRYPQVRVQKFGQVTVAKTDYQWYALQTHSRHEKQVRDRLRAVGIEPLLPLGKQCRQWSDRKVWTTLPLFSGYCFANFALAGSLAVLQTPGVVRIVGTVRPEPIPVQEIAVLQQVSSVNPTDRTVRLPYGRRMGRSDTRSACRPPWPTRTTGESPWASDPRLPPSAGRAYPH